MAGAAASGTGAGGVAHADSSASTAAAAIEDNDGNGIRIGEQALGWVFLEIALALVIAGAIVWWTLPRKPRRGDAGKDGDGKAGR